MLAGQDGEDVDGARITRGACDWGDQPTNVLWVTSGEVRTPADRRRVTRPARPVNWEKENGAYVGWLLPGA